MSSNQYGPVSTAPEEFENKAFFLRLGVPSTLNRHEKGAFRKRSLNRRKFNRPTFRFRVDENIFWKRSFSRTMASLGAIHSTKISGLRFENILGANGSRRVRKVSFHSILMLITVARVRVEWQIRLYQWSFTNCFMCRNFTRVVFSRPRYVPF